MYVCIFLFLFFKKHNKIVLSLSHFMQLYVLIIFSWWTEEHEESVYNHYISELRNFRMHLEAHEEHLIRQLRTPLERDDLEQSLQRITEHKACIWVSKIIWHIQELTVIVLIMVFHMLHCRRRQRSWINWRRTLMLWRRSVSCSSDRLQVLHLFRCCPLNSPSSFRAWAKCTPCPPFIWTSKILLLFSRSNQSGI